jgi:hypothetical protein
VYEDTGVSCFTGNYFEKEKFFFLFLALNPTKDKRPTSKPNQNYPLPNPPSEASTLTPN